MYRVLHNVYSAFAKRVTEAHFCREPQYNYSAVTSSKVAPIVGRYKNLSTGSLQEVCAWISEVDEICRQFDRNNKHIEPYASIVLVREAMAKASHSIDTIPIVVENIGDCSAAEFLPSDELVEWAKEYLSTN